MATPSGTITAGNINTEEGYSSTATMALDTDEIRRLANKLTGAISYGDLRSKTMFRRPTVFTEITSDGSYASEANARNGSTITLDTASYATVSKSAIGTYELYEKVKWSNFGSGTRTGKVHIYVYGICSDDAVSATSDIEIWVNGTSVANMHSTLSGSPAIFGPDYMTFSTLTDCNLSTLRVEVECGGGRVVLGDGCSATCRMYDIVFIGT
jgi:hypothetical protein